MTVLLAEGHLLIEDVPGVGKTMLAKALARSIDCSVKRIQFTPDLLPSDVTGVSVFNQDTRDFEFKPGAVFANIVVGDEINRASPKTQSALLECMEERQVTVDGTTYLLAARRSWSWPPRTRSRWRAPTRSPRRSATGSWPACRWAIPTRSPSSPCSTSTAATRSCWTSARSTDAVEIAQLVHAVRGVHVSDAVRQYVIDLVGATRRSPDLRLGASPRAALHLRPRGPGLGGPRRPRLRHPRRHPAAGRARCSPTACS